MKAKTRVRVLSKVVDVGASTITLTISGPLELYPIQAGDVVEIAHVALDAFSRHIIQEVRPALVWRNRLNRRKKKR